METYITFKKEKQLNNDLSVRYSVLKKDGEKREEILFPDSCVTAEEVGKTSSTGR